MNAIYSLSRISNFVDFSILAFFLSRSVLKKIPDIVLFYPYIVKNMEIF